MITEDKGSEGSKQPDAIQLAIAFGVDVTLLQENLKLSPTARLTKAQRGLESMLALQSEAKTFRAKRAKL